MDPLARLLETLDAMSGPAWVTGTAEIATPITIDGTNIASPTFAAWLRARSELAPFGDDEGTRLDENVRSTLRLQSRGATDVRGIDLARICDEIATAFSTEREVTAKLHDVLLYPVGGKFDRHKDTPAGETQLGSLIINIPHHHEGGWLRVDDGDEEALIDWSGAPPNALRWVAIYGDVNHEISEVLSGERITIVYSLSLGAPRTDQKRKALVDEMTDAMIHVVEDEWATRDFILPCRHLIITPRGDVAYPLPIDVLRGDDRIIADAFARCGANVSVVEILTFGAEHVAEDAPPVPSIQKVPQLATHTLDVIKAMPASMFDHRALAGRSEGDGDTFGWYEDGDPLDVGVIEPYVTWHRAEHELVIRQKARALLAFDGMWSATGYFGNEYSHTHVYRIAGIRVQFTSER
ncbi:MAG: 2OG-Fe(II) oxygenase [Kofleriaceae bacterium]